MPLPITLSEGMVAVVGVYTESPQGITPNGSAIFGKIEAVGTGVGTFAADQIVLVKVSSVLPVIDYDGQSYTIVTVEDILLTEDPIEP